MNDTKGIDHTVTKRKRTNNDLRNTTQKTKDRAPRTSLKIRGSIRVSSFCSTYGTRRVTLVTNPVMNEERTGLWIRQTEHIHGHL